jgi:hypothetical protein
VHLFLHEEEQDISVVMKRIGTSYAWWYNQSMDIEQRNKMIKKM